MLRKTTPEDTGRSKEELLIDDQPDVPMSMPDMLPPPRPPPLSDAASATPGPRGSKRKASCLQPGGHGAQPDDGKEYVTCRRCKKPKEVGLEISKQCAECKRCRGVYECCERMATRQGKAEWFKETEQNDPRNFQTLLITYGKCCPGDANNYNRRQGTFPLMQFISEVSVEGGKTVERAFKMMWEREYIEEAQKTYMGNLTFEEAQRQWAEWKANPQHPQDHQGPRGFLRLEVPTGDYHKYYQAGPGSPGRPSGLNLIARPRPPRAHLRSESIAVCGRRRGIGAPPGSYATPPAPVCLFSAPRPTGRETFAEGRPQGAGQEEGHGR